MWQLRSLPHEVFLTLNGERHSLWRAVDQDGNVLDILGQSRRHKQAAQPGFRKLLKGLTSVPRVILTDKLKSDGAAKHELLPGVEHHQSRYLTNRGEGSHLPTRQREPRMPRVKSPGHAQPVLSASSPMAQPFRPQRHLEAAPDDRQEMKTRFEIGQETRTATASATASGDAMLLPASSASQPTLSGQRPSVRYAIVY